MKIDIKQIQQFDPTTTLSRMVALAQARIGSQEWLPGATDACVNMTNYCPEMCRAGLVPQSRHWPAVTGSIEWVPNQGWMHVAWHPTKEPEDHRRKDYRYFPVCWDLVKVQSISLNVDCSKDGYEHNRMNLRIQVESDEIDDPESKDVCIVHLRRKRRIPWKEPKACDYYPVTSARRSNIQYEYGGSHMSMSEDATMHVRKLDLPAVLDWMFEFGHKAAAKIDAEMAAELAEMAAEEQSLAKGD